MMFNNVADYAMFRALERQVLWLSHELDTFAEYACASSDKALQSWAVGYAKSRPGLGERLDRIIAERTGHASAEFVDAPL